MSNTKNQQNLLHSTNVLKEHLQSQTPKRGYLDFVIEAAEKIKAEDQKINDSIKLNQKNSLNQKITNSFKAGVTLFSAGLAGKLLAGSFIGKALATTAALGGVTGFGAIMLGASAISLGVVIPLGIAYYKNREINDTKETINFINRNRKIDNSTTLKELSELTDQVIKKVDNGQPVNFEMNKLESVIKSYEENVLKNEAILKKNIKVSSKESILDKIKKSAESKFNNTSSLNKKNSI